MNNQIIDIPILALANNPWNDDIYGVEVDQALLDSIQEYGILTPVIVTSVNANSQHTPAHNLAEYWVISGCRRVQHAKMVGLQDVPAIVVDPFETAGEFHMEVLHSNLYRDKTPSVKVNEFMSFYELIRENSLSRRAANIYATSSSVVLAEHNGQENAVQTSAAASIACQTFDNNEAGRTWEKVAKLTGLSRRDQAYLQVVYAVSFRNETEKQMRALGMTDAQWDKLCAMWSKQQSECRANQKKWRSAWIAINTEINTLQEKLSQDKSAKRPAKKAIRKPKQIDWQTVACYPQALEAAIKSNNKKQVLQTLQDCIKYLKERE